jgi:hypothetical protein
MEQDSQFRRALEDAGKQAVGDDLNFRRGISIGGETKIPFVMRWLREKERERESRTSVRSLVASNVLGCSRDAHCCGRRGDRDRHSFLNL